MGILAEAALTGFNGKRWDQNPLLAIGLTPCVLRAGFSDDDLFAICQKQARRQLVIAHPDRTNEENDEQRIFSTAFGFLKDRDSFDAALKELRKIASDEEREIVRIKREATHLRETRDAALKQADVVSRENIKLTAQVEPLSTFLKALLRAQTTRVTRSQPGDWSIPGVVSAHGAQQEVTYTYLWGHSTTSAARNAVSIENLLLGLHARAVKEKGFPWGVVGENRSSPTHRKVFGEHSLSPETIPAMEVAYRDSLIKLRGVCESIHYRRPDRKRVHTDEAVCGMRTSVIARDAIMFLSTGCNQTRYRIIGSLQLPSSIHEFPFSKFGDSGFVELPWEKALRFVTPVLKVGWMLIGIRIKESRGAEITAQRPTNEVLKNLHQNPFTVLGSILAIK